MLILIILFPFLGFLSGSLFGRFIGLGVCYITTFFTFLSFLLSLILLFTIIKSGDMYFLHLTQ
jgi:NADH:ubiquinone oxidoreductase subunit 5 (subunit L)/multisubunit Na+/H+ antiporter MnhA subunit